MDFRKLMAFVITFSCLFLLLPSCSTSTRLARVAEAGVSPAQAMEEAGAEYHASTLPVLYHSGASWNARSLDLIERAEDYILVSTFLGVEHPSVYPVWQALAKKAQSGVKVYILIDSSSNFQVVSGTMERIKAAYLHLMDMGLEVVEYNSLSLSNLFFIPKLFDRDHRKYWIVDGTVLAIGGVNVNHTSVAFPKGIGNIDTMAEIVSPGATRAVVETFVDTWNNYSPQQLDAKDFPVPEIDLSRYGEVGNVWLIDHYWPSQSQISTLFDLFSTYAQRELWLIQGYTFLTPGLLERIRYAADRGVQVNIMLSDYSSQPKYEMASRYGILDLLDAGATVYVYSSPDKAFLHAKLMMADGKLVTIGSANYNYRSQFLSRELNILYEDERLGSQTAAYIEELLADCRKVDRDEAESYRSIRTWYNFVLMQIWG